MSDLYWISVIGNIGETICAILFICVVLFLGVGLWTVLEYGDHPFMSDKEKEEKQQARAGAKRFLKKTAIVGVIFAVVSIFFPSTKQLYAIYGIGEAIDYVKSNEKARQLPDKVVVALDKWLEEDKEE